MNSISFEWFDFLNLSLSYCFENRDRLTGSRPKNFQDPGSDPGSNLGLNPGSNPGRILARSLCILQNLHLKSFIVTCDYAGRTTFYMNQ